MNIHGDQGLRVCDSRRDAVLSGTSWTFPEKRSLVEGAMKRSSYKDIQGA